LLALRTDRLDYQRILLPENIAWAAVYFLYDETPMINGVMELKQFPILVRQTHSLTR
jgi:hypothetical protein